MVALDTDLELGKSSAHVKQSPRERRAAHILLARGGDGAAGSPVPHVREPPWRAKRGTNSSGGKRESESQSTGPGIITSPPCFHSTNFLSAKSQKQQPRKKKSNSSGFRSSILRPPEQMKQLHRTKCKNGTGTYCLSGASLNFRISIQQKV
jgi:hypothetical protein